ncbi:hypothetical protein ACWPMX_07765 [Tsuneonella sp. HG094]
MAQQTIGLGTVANDGTGDTLRVAGGKANDNFTELYAAVADLVAAVAGKADSSEIAAAVAALVDSSPGTLDTLNELAAALGDDPNFATTIATALAGKLAAANNLSDVANPATARDNLGLEIGADVQAYSANLAALASAGGLKQGTHTIPVLAGAMVARTTNGAASGTTESTTNKVMTRTLDFDQSTDEFAQVSIPMPKSWDEGNVAVQFVWTAGATGNVVWGAQAQYQRDDDPVDGAWGTAQTVTDGVTASGDRMVSAFTNAITPAGTGGNECSLLVQVYRDADNGSDTLVADAKLLAIRVNYTVNAGDDS